MKVCDSSLESFRAPSNQVGRRNKGRYVIRKEMNLIYGNELNDFKKKFSQFDIVIFNLPVTHKA